MNCVAEEPCISDGCHKPAEKNRKYCPGHRKRAKQHKSVDTPLREWGTDPRLYVEAKAAEMCNAADDDRAHKLARKRFWWAIERLFRKRQKVPNTQKNEHHG
jgi:hypothetical protein